MAKMNSILGEVKGKLGEVVGQNWMGKRVLRKYTPNVHNPRTTEQERNRAIFKQLVRMGSGFYNAIHESMSITARQRGPMTATNLFIKENYYNVNLSNEGEMEVDYQNLVVSTGQLTGAEFGTMRVDDSTNLTVNFTSPDVSLQNSKGSSLDLVHAFAYCEELNEGILSEGAKRSARSVSLSLPTHWVGKKVVVYGFVAGGQKGITKGRYSQSQYVGTQVLA